MHIEERLLELLMVASMVAMIARRKKLPYTVALVISGLLIGHLELITDFHLSPTLLFAVLLPALLYEAAFHLDIEDFNKNIGAILTLAVPGLLVAIIATAGVLYFLIRPFVDGFEFKYALLFGAIIAATDPISVLAVFKNLGVTKRLSIIVEGESLLNDGAAVVVFGILLGAISGIDIRGQIVQGDLSLAHVLMEFAKVAGGGLLIGAAVGFILSLVTSRIDDHLIEIMLTTVLAYGSYLIAERMHVSGVIAVVAAGMMSGNFGTRFGMSPTTKISVTDFWEYAAFVANSLVFLLVGLEINLTAMWKALPVILIAWVAVIIGRIVTVYLSWPVMNRVGNPIPASWCATMVGGGIRGSIAMVLVLALPADFPYRDVILPMTFGVVIITLIGHGALMKPFMQLLGLVNKTDDREEYERQRAIRLAAGTALRELNRLSDEHSVTPDIYEATAESYKNRIQETDDAIHALHLEREEIHDAEMRAVKRHLLAVEKESIRASFREGLVSEEISKKLINEVDVETDIMENPLDEDNDST